MDLENKKKKSYTLSAGNGQICAAFVVSARRNHLMNVFVSSELECLIERPSEGRPGWGGRGPSIPNKTYGSWNARESVREIEVWFHCG